MYKAFVLVVLVLVGVASGSTSLKTRSPNIQRITHVFPQSNVRLDWCPECINGFGELIEILLNLIVDSGIAGTCGTLCQAVAEKTGSEILGTLCTLACDFVGIDEFIKLIIKVDLDPIWYCEIVNLCPINDNGDAKITTFNILPARAPIGTTFAIDFGYVTKNGTGTGEITIAIACVDKLNITGTFLLEEKKPGTYGERYSIQAEPDPECDPSRGPCEQWLPGIYPVTVEICYGQCGSHHPHSAIYDVAKGSFILYEQ